MMVRFLQTGDSSQHDIRGERQEIVTGELRPRNWVGSCQPLRTLVQVEAGRRAQDEKRILPVSPYNSLRYKCCTFASHGPLTATCPMPAAGGVCYETTTEELACDGSFGWGALHARHRAGARGARSVSDGAAGTGEGSRGARGRWRAARIAIGGVWRGAGDALPGEAGRGDDHQGGATKPGVSRAHAGAAGGGAGNLPAGRGGDHGAHQPRGTGRPDGTSEDLADV